jgi:CubicO group peptidase (beta-lactamase class C family)
LKRAAVALVLALLWTTLVAAGFYLHAMYVWTPGVRHGDLASVERFLHDTLTRATADRRIASAALVLIRDGGITSEHAFGTARQRTQTLATTDSSVYIVASVSKAVTAWGVMKLVETGRLSLDGPVISHLRRWRFPSSTQYRDRVTVRHLLSHTAGLDDGLGFGGFAADQPRQRIEEALGGPRDSTVGPVGEIVVVREPGTAMAYSGGGYAVLQLLVEEVSGQPFARYMADAVMAPLGMIGATFDPELLSAALVLADGVDARLAPQPPRRYTAVASVGLHATARDLARFAQALVGPNPVLSGKTMAAMLTAQPGTGGSWGLGHAIFVDTPGARIIGHDGGTPPSWGASVRVNPATGNGFVLLASGGDTLVTTMADAWTFGESGVVTASARRQALIDRIRLAVMIMAVGAVVIAMTFVFRRTPAESG